MNSFKHKIGLFSIIIICILNINFIQCLPVNKTVNPLNVKEVKLLVANNKPKAYENKTVVKYQDQKAGQKKTIEGDKGDSFKETYGSSDEIEYHKVFHTKGSKGYDNFETFHKKDSNEYELKDEDKSGEHKKKKHEKESNESKESDKNSKSHKHGQELLEEDVSMNFEEADVQDDVSKKNSKNSNELEHSSEENKSIQDKSHNKKASFKTNKGIKLIGKSLSNPKLKFSQKMHDKHKHKLCKKPSRLRLLNKIGLPFKLKSNNVILRKLPQIDNIFKNKNKLDSNSKILKGNNKTNFIRSDEMKTSENNNIQVFSIQSGILSSKLPIRQNFKLHNKTEYNHNTEPMKIFSNSTINGRIIEVIEPQALSQVEANFIPNKSFGYDTIIYHDEEDVAQSLKNDSPDEKNSIINFYSPDLGLKNDNKNVNDKQSESKEELSKGNSPELENDTTESQGLLIHPESFSNSDSVTLDNENSQEPEIFTETTEIRNFNEYKPILNHKMEDKSEYRPKKHGKLKHHLKIVTEPYYDDGSSQSEIITTQRPIKTDKNKKKNKKKIKRPQNESVESTIKQLELKNTAALRANANESEETAVNSERNSRKINDENNDQFTELPTTENHNRKKKSKRKHVKKKEHEKNNEQAIRTDSSEVKQNISKNNYIQKTPRHKQYIHEKNEMESKPTKNYSTDIPKLKQNKKKKKLINTTTTIEPDIYYDDELNDQTLKRKKSKSSEDESEIYYDEIKNLDDQDFVIVVDDDKQIQASKSKQTPKPKIYKVQDSSEDESDESNHQAENIPTNNHNKNIKTYDTSNDSSEESNEPNNNDECTNCDYDYEEE